jgi:conjugal transfer pilus assembly protein TraF
MSPSSRIAAAAAAAAATLALSAHAADTAPTYWGGSTWQDPDRGFLWYAPPKPPKSDKPQPKAKKPYQQLTNKELGAEIERLLALAVEKQSPEAVKEYLFLQQYAMDRASSFSDVFRRTVWTTPELDYSLRSRPTNAIALAAYDQQRDGRKAAASDQLAKTHGMFFFFRGNCTYCHQLAPILKMYERQYGVEVFPVSLDGGTLAAFPNAKLDNGMSQNLNVSTVPAVFLADKRTGRIQPVGYGVMSLDELVNRVYVLTSTQPGQEY